MSVTKTKSKMISELKAEFLKKQGSDKAKWVSNKLRTMNKAQVEQQYKRLKGKVSSTKKELGSGLKLRKSVIIGARKGRMFIQPVR